MWAWIFRPECSEQVNGFQGAKYKKFNTETDAEKFIAENQALPNKQPSDSKPPVSKANNFQPNIRTKNIQPEPSGEYIPLGQKSNRFTGSTQQQPNINSGPSDTRTLPRQRRVHPQTNGMDIPLDEPLLEMQQQISELSTQLKEITQNLSLLKKKFKYYVREKRGVNIRDENLESNDSNISTKRPLDTDSKTSSAKRPSNTLSNDLQSLLEDGNDDLFNFVFDDNGYVVVYTDGACSNNGRPNAKAGLGVWFDENHPL